MRGPSLLSAPSSRFFSSDPPIDGNSADIKNMMDNENKGKPLSRLSDDDLQLAIQAANEDEELSASCTTKSSIDFNQIPGASKGGSRKLAIIFTCNVCDTRSAKRFTERAYNHGVVLIRCPKCDSLHLIADRLGYFSDKDDGKGWDIETFMKSIGQEDNIKVATEGQEVFEGTLKDVLGDKIHDSMDDPEDSKKD
jgi:protein import protein ZIM17